MNQLVKKMTVILLMGFSSGLPLLLTGGTLQAWMTDSGIDIKVIGIYALVGLPYTLKFLWAPFLDRFIPSKLGRRRSWMLITQVLLAATLFAFSGVNPAESLGALAFLAVLVTFFSASQDIVLDAYRREYLNDEELGLGSSLFVNGYRIGMLAAGSLALFFADRMPWSTVYMIMAGFMGIGILTTLFVPEPVQNVSAPKSLQEAVIMPLAEFFSRKGAFFLLLFVLLYKVGDSMAANMTTPFILQIGFSKTELAAIAKTFGLAAMIIGGIVGGALMLKMAIRKALFAFGILQMISTAGFSLLAFAGHNRSVLTGVIAFENFSAGLGTAAYVAFMTSLCNKKFTATQYALLSSLIGIPRTILSAPTGYLADYLGWSSFFIFCTLVAIPGLVLIFYLKKWEHSFGSSIELAST